MHPAFSVIFLTTLIGVGQGLFLALFSSQTYSIVNVLPAQPGGYYALGGLIALGFLAAGLVASFFHLGHPERAWRSASQWRTSWLSREVIALPLVMGLLFLYAVVNWLELDADLFGWRLHGQVPLIVGALGAAATLGLFLCTGMIYGAVKFLQTWATPLTVLNYFLLGSASGFVFAAAYAAFKAPNVVEFYAAWAMVLIVAAFAGRAAALLRNARIKQVANLQTAIGIRHSKVQQRAMGFMGGSYNTREYRHGKGLAFLKSVKWIFLALVFPIPFLLLWLGLALGSSTAYVAAFAVQYVGLLFERWFFFAQADHPQNLYYQVVG
ncbi:MAG: DMSO reductase [Hydrogenophilales bacterium CG03_land_8_20_14_0_80_62_28]|nr:dimethyl sulfoxide reductase anchor subunit [Betaproteobacteria bacterium]OIO77760.1 MAG: DMSO reductase [Hydrogenophilaceae bacterium CG1_02_62_390]PIV22381.1 MAG: DMSO reductase [Hydrogenophilales bacterium CG03_land_8_20_14_0_80_62_28]PIW38485.1 MAG: DMSO reductase [Hydrogenophilales bacterium CG15_BIG_FIL_POST_REV_8_21_14_020_62_31]PIW71236.1 MAG: DMSO reductase [Hydrogenophilales bacterium CG12_big_fil_rev_8_21_14_0_65_61_21]PIX02410.1 MAG: DMSO reductase [Hydrogenophilales bacterium C